ncbi:glycosyltransferase [Pseudohaliea sp.]|uniref:glycosyltransferase n=1 Tax=Pseudohaliea sp. TaxID=2740289 RepID=UPI0032EACE9E
MKDRGVCKRRAIHVPDWSDGNPYQGLLAQALARRGWNVTFKDYGQGPLPLVEILRRENDVEVIHIHWLAPYLARAMWSSSKLRLYIKTFLLISDVVLCRLMGCRVVWTVHNLCSHESSDTQRERWIRKKLSKVVSHKIFHSESARQSFGKQIASVDNRRSSIIPHGNYIGVYPESEDILKSLRSRLCVPVGHRVILFFGAVRRYKGLGDLITAFRQSSASDLRLVIAGNPMDRELREDLEETAQLDDRIILYLKFIPEEEVAPLHRLADLVVIPFKEIFTSGSVLLAMSLSKPVALPRNAEQVGILQGGHGLSYTNSVELLDIINRAGSQGHRAIAEKNYLAAKHCCWARIGEATAGTYR